MLLANKKVEIILVSMDQNVDDFNEFLYGIPWPAVPYNDNRIENLIHIFEVDERKLPQMILINKEY